MNKSITIWSFFEIDEHHWAAFCVRILSSFLRSPTSCCFAFAYTLLAALAIWQDRIRAAVRLEDVRVEPAEL